VLHSKDSRKACKIRPFFEFIRDDYGFDPPPETLCTAFREQTRSRLFQVFRLCQARWDPFEPAVNWCIRARELLASICATKSCQHCRRSYTVSETLDLRTDSWAAVFA